MDKKVAQVFLDKDMYKWLQEQAKAQRCSISHVLRTLVLKEMKRLEAGS
jgi:hypothetical protein